MIIVQTPLRVSLLGGGTDIGAYYRNFMGMVVSSAIDKYVFVIVSERFDDLIYVNYSRKEIASSVDQISHELVREAMLKTGVTSGVEITMLADIPSEGSGLGSSSSLTVGLLNALYCFTGVQKPNVELAKEACDIEINRCKKPIGKQDQYIAAIGGLCSIRFHASEEVVATHMQLTNRQIMSLSSNLMLFFTGVTRKSSDILMEQVTKTPEKLSELNQIRDLAVMAEDSLMAGDFDQLGDLMDRNWQYKKQLSSGVTNPTLEALYAKARNAGAIGGKIAGAGGGGFLLLYCRPETQDRVRLALAGLKEMPFMLERDGSKIIFNYRRYRWK